jgi:hypothetical protein
MEPKVATSIEDRLKPVTSGPLRRLTIKPPIKAPHYTDDDGQDYSAGIWPRHGDLGQYPGDEPHYYLG